MDYLGTNLHGLSDEDLALKDSVQKFARDVMRPIATELDGMSAEAVIAPDSPFWTFMRKSYELGYHTITFPEQVGGLGLTPLQQSIVVEELGWGSYGLTLVMQLGLHALAPAIFQNEELIKEFTIPFCQCKDGKSIGCWGITEPDHGSDTLMAGYPSFRDPNIKAQCRARLEGNEWIISGQKAAWVSAGTIATHCVLFCQVDPSKGHAGGGIFIVPLDLPGVTRGKPLEMFGVRDLNQGEIYFDDVHISKRYMLIGPDIYEVVLEAWLSGTTSMVAMWSVGVARAGFEEALNYARQREQGGKLLVEHPNVQQKLFNMYRKVEASRQLCRAAYVYARTAQNPVLEYSLAAKTFASDTALEVTSDAIQIFGGNGLSSEYLIGKLFRDARAGMICDGSNDSLALKGGHLLAQHYPRKS